MKQFAPTPSRKQSRLPAGRWFVLAVLLLLLAVVPAARAQSQISELSNLEIELWPDYDRPAVLVLLTGTLADNVPAPATLTLPIPEGASINAVAHADAASGQLQNVGDVDTSQPGQISFTTPSPTFRIEYYMPYTADGDQREFVFDWSADITIDQLLATVQQPAEARDFVLSPAADSPTTGRDGLLYHPLPPRALPAGATFLLNGSYTLEGGVLSIEVIPTPQPAVEGPLPLVGQSPQESGSDFNWPLVVIVAGGLVIVAAVAWFLYTNNQNGRRRPPKPRPNRQPVVRSTKSSTASAGAGAQFCHNCGQVIDPGDRFCRDCGTPLRER